ncbi:thiamine-phosphate diphosphorylase [Curtobacterium luteum]|uniref:Thiamine-phosphate synthase n=1 Tax=Curtobacterium luteum TaxID=33881 RepID=A0A8H9GA67_9MICO|nr:thiamine phosphate synthase [Curtobacterium luteum]MBM7801168.1 thiamine-phosphate diphosphorylase [Curtobacterium luteum]GGK96266.1 thiamine-phosphate synthase [Curtobacterium luteum]
MTGVGFPGGRSDVGVYLVTDTALAGRHGHGVVEVVRAAVAAGVRTVQVRDKHASARDLLALSVAVADAVGARATVVVDDRLDVVLAARHAGHRVAGVHLGQSDVPVTVARALLGPGAHVGLTANTPEHLDAVAALPSGTVDLLGVGVVHPTTTKADHPEPLGVAGFGRIARSTGVPCVAIGGVTLEDVAALRAAGAAGVAVVSGICAAPDPGAAAAAYVTAWRTGGARDGAPRLQAGAS